MVKLTEESKQKIKEMLFPQKVIFEFWCGFDFIETDNFKIGFDGEKHTLFTLRQNAEIDEYFIKEMNTMISICKMMNGQRT